MTKEQEENLLDDTKHCDSFSVNRCRSAAFQAGCRSSQEWVILLALGEEIELEAKELENALGEELRRSESLRAEMEKEVQRTADAYTAQANLAENIRREGALRNETEKELQRTADALRAEVARLTECLAKANANHEYFERIAYLMEMERDKMREERDIAVENHSDTITQLEGAEKRNEVAGEEFGRWQNEIRNLLIDLSGAPNSAIDGGGCDSGDPLDVTKTEIKQAFNFVRDERDGL